MRIQELLSFVGYEVEMLVYDSKTDTAVRKFGKLSYNPKTTHFTLEEKDKTSEIHYIDVMMIKILKA